MQQCCAFETFLSFSAEGIPRQMQEVAENEFSLCVLSVNSLCVLSVKNSAYPKQFLQTGIPETYSSLPQIHAKNF